MDEMFEPRKKEKLDKSFFKSFIFMFIIGLFLVLGTSYSLEFFKANKNVGTIRLNTSAIDITVTGDNTINQSLTKYPDNEGIVNGLNKSFHITNENNSIGRILLKLERTSGIELSNIKYALSVNDIIIKVSSIPSDGIIFDEVMLGEEELDVKVTLWADNDYSGSLDFNGTITNEMKRTNTTANDVLEEIIDYDNILAQTNNYVRFNNELYRIVKEEDNRLVICKNADFDSSALTRVNSNKFNSSLTYQDNSIIYSHSTDSKNLYLVETVNIKSGRGLETDPFILENTRKNFDDKKVTAYIAYQDDNNQTLFTQPIYYDEINYIGYAMNDPDFVNWENNNINYYLGNPVSFASDVTLTPVIHATAFSTIARGATLDTTIDFSKISPVSTSDLNGQGKQILKGTENDQYPIYYYRGEINNNNVVFGDMCWQVVRTTDTGGVKMIYNGEALISGSGDNITYDCGSTRPAGHIEYTRRTTSISGNYYYADDYEITNVSGTTVTYRLKSKVNAITQVSITSSNASANIATIAANYPYTCKSTSSTGTCTTLYKVDSWSSGTTANVYRSIFMSKIAQKHFNVKDDSVSGIGYMDNARYSRQNTVVSEHIETMLSSTSLKTTYWYATSVTWGSPTANKYNLDSPYQVTGTSDYPNLVHQYTFNNSTQTYTNTSVNYITAVNDSTSTMYYINLTDSGNHTLADFNYTYTYGDGYTDNHDNTYTITDTNSVTTINRSDWYTNYTNLKNKFVCKNATNNTCSEVWYATNTSRTTMDYIIKPMNIKYAKDIYNYDETTSTYTLDNATSVTFLDITNSTNKTSLNNAHYTCWNEEGTCQTLSYIYYFNNRTIRYIDLTNGDTIEDALYKMTGNGSAETKIKNDGYVLNQNDSVAKEIIEDWFRTKLTNEVDVNNPNYRAYIEDTVYCNDRSYKTVVGSSSYPIYEQSGWNPNGGDLLKYLYFGRMNRLYNNWYSTTNIPSMICSNETDSFSVSSSVAHLNYPVGLLTTDELILAGASGGDSTTNNKYYLYTGYLYWLMSPSQFNSGASYVANVNSSGNNIDDIVSNESGLRPVVSLKHGTEFEDGGDGTPTNPYVVKYNS